MPNVMQLPKIAHGLFTPWFLPGDIYIIMFLRQSVVKFQAMKQGHNQARLINTSQTRPTYMLKYARVG